MFATAIRFQTGLIFQARLGAYQGNPAWGTTLVGSYLDCKYKIMVEVNGSGKHSSLLRYTITAVKSLIVRAPWVVLQNIIPKSYDLLIIIWARFCQLQIADLKDPVYSCTIAHLPNGTVHLCVIQT